MDIPDFTVYINLKKPLDDHMLLEVPEDTLFSKECAWEKGSDILSLLEAILCRAELAAGYVGGGGLPDTQRAIKVVNKTWCFMNKINGQSKRVLNLCN